MLQRRAIVLWIIALLAFWSPSTFASDDDIVVIVNKANSAKALSKEDLRPLFQTTQTQWSGGARAVPLSLPEDSPIRKGFDAAVLGLDPERVAKFWIDRKIRGGERPPRKVPSPAIAVRIVSSDENAVGYVNAKDVDNTVRVVARIRGGQVAAP